MKMNKAKLAAFISLALAPAIYLIVKFSLFKPKEMVEINLWLILALIVFAAVLSVLIYYCVSALKTKYFWWKQILVGFAKVILPLTVLYAALTWMSENVDLLKEFILITILCEGGAIVVNPFPEWCFNNNVDGLAEIADKVFHREQEQNAEEQEESNG